MVQHHWSKGWRGWGDRQRRGWERQAGARSGRTLGARLTVHSLGGCKWRPSACALDVMELLHNSSGLCTQTFIWERKKKNPKLLFCLNFEITNIKSHRESPTYGRELKPQIWTQSPRGCVQWGVQRTATELWRQVLWGFPHILPSIAAELFLSCLSFSFSPCPRDENKPSLLNHCHSITDVLLQP